MELFPKEKLDEILDEIAGYNIELEEDPTQPHLKTNYLQKMVSKCRAYQNRVHSYLLVVKRQENNIKREIKDRELDIEVKMREKLADDTIVRQQPSIEDRKAMAASMLSTEFKELAEFKIALLDTEETFKLIKSKYDQLKQIASDIKLQRALVRDDILERTGGGEGYTAPKSGQGGVVKDGLPPAVIKDKDITPSELRDGVESQSDLPTPVNAAHAKRIKEFLEENPIKNKDNEADVKSVKITDLII